MKNHIKVNGKILQTNKKWSHLKQKQRECISNWLREEHHKFVQVHDRSPKKQEHEDIVDAVIDKIVEAEIWIPHWEVKGYYMRKHAKWYRKIGGNLK
ncbi:transposase [Bacillus thuringiensis]|uniref:transposase n=1 Tax=Bacillus thuringiensis TaxID=1428 RepID=UPI0011A33F5F|nr:transposase [Bacillus thuringiensis]